MPKLRQAMCSSLAAYGAEGHPAKDPGSCRQERDQAKSWLDGARWTVEGGYAGPISLLLHSCARHQ
eukprot:14535748-Alexandrium_andersonii.AAC.1